MVTSPYGGKILDWGDKFQQTKSNLRFLSVCSERVVFYLGQSSIPFFVDGIELFGPKKSLVPLPGVFCDSLMKLFLKILANKFCTRYSSFSRIDKFHKL